MREVKFYSKNRSGGMNRFGAAKGTNSRNLIVREKNKVLCRADYSDW